MLPLFALLFALPAGLDAGDSVELGDSAHYFGLEVPSEAAIGDEMTVKVYFGTDEALAEDVHIFLHIQSQESTCRMVRDEQPVPADDGTIAHEFRVTIPDTPVCDPQRMEIYTGLYHRGRGGRFRVQGATTSDDRIHAGYFDIVRGDTTEPEAIAPSDMKLQRFLSLAQPFDYWLLGLLISVLLTLGLRFWLGRRPEAREETEAEPDAKPEPEPKPDAEADADEGSDPEEDEKEEGEEESGEEEEEDDDDDPYAEDDEEDEDDEES